jgi:predicted acyl esterase
MSSAPAPAVRVDRDLVIPLADGTRLAADLCRPDTPGPVPVLVSCYPYRKDDIIGSLFEGTRIRLCERGYATVFADMTGTGASEGDYGESFDLAREGRDAAAVVEWAAGQDWCDGRVGAWGVSYGGMTALAGAPSHAVTWQAHPERDAYWDSRVLDAAAIDVPVMLIGGWADMFKDAMTSLYTAVTGPKRLVMGPWMHVLPHLSGVEPYDWVSEMADWWDEHLGSAPPPPRDPVLFYARGAGWRGAGWHGAGQWPPETLDPPPAVPSSMGPNEWRSRSGRPLSPSRRGRGCGCPWPAPIFPASGRRRRTRRSASASARTIPRRCAYPCAIAMSPRPASRHRPRYRTPAGSPGASPGTTWRTTRQRARWR